MYEARRQRSSWARIKLSIVRKVMSISYSFWIRCSTFFVVLSLLFELTSFLLRFLSFSSSTILLSRFNSYLCSLSFLATKSESSHKICYLISYFNFGFNFARSLVITLTFLTQTLKLSLGQSACSVVSLPTNSILSLQNCLSTIFIFEFLQFVTLYFLIEFSKFIMCYLYISALRWCPSVFTATVGT